MKSTRRKTLGTVACLAACVALGLTICFAGGVVNNSANEANSADAEETRTLSQTSLQDEDAENEVTSYVADFEQMKELESSQAYRNSVEYVDGEVVFTVRDVRDDGADAERLNAASAFSCEAGLGNVEFVYESESKTTQVADGQTAYDVYYKATTSEADVWDAVDALNGRDDVLYAEPNIEWENTAVGDYTEATAEEVHEAWQLDAINVNAAWQKAYDAGINPGQGAVVAVIDTGVDYSHVDLANSMWKNDNEVVDGKDNDGDGYVDDVYGINLITGSGNPIDDHGHGTHVAGIIAAQAGNGGSVGVSYGAQIMAIKAGQSTGTFASSDIAKAVNYAQEHGADVINMSFGGSGRSAIVEAALADAYSTCVLVASAGNDGLPTYEASVFDNYTLTVDIYPAGYSYVLGVMSCDGNGNGNMSSFSNWDYMSQYGCEYEVIAPGENVYSTLPGNRYAKWSGTSMAAPEVSAAAAILRSLNTDKSKYTSQYIMGQLSSATDSYVGYIGRYEDQHSFAKLDVLASIEKVPRPSLSVVETYLLDSPSISEKNNGDGIAQPGETIDMGVVVRNQWGIASNVTLSADAMSSGEVASPYITFVTDRVEIQDIGTFANVDNGFVYEDSVLTGVSNPIRFTVSEDATNDMVLAINLHVSASNGMNAEDTSIYSTDGSKTFTVQNGQTLHGTLKEDTTLTSDKLWIIDAGLFVPEGVTLTVEPGTKIQFWSSDPSDPYATTSIPFIAVGGTMNCTGTQDSPISIYPGKGFENYAVSIARVKHDDSNNTWRFYTTNDYVNDYDGSAVVNLNYCYVENPGQIYDYASEAAPGFNITSLNHCYVRQISTYETTHLEDSQIAMYPGNLTADNVKRSVFSIYSHSCSARLQSIEVEECHFENSNAEICSDSFANTTFSNISRYPSLYNMTYVKDANRYGKRSNLIQNCAILNNLNNLNMESWMGIIAKSGTGEIDISGNYWGTSDAKIVKKQVTDADTNPLLYDLVQEPYLTLESKELETIYPFVTEAYVTDLDGNRLESVNGSQEVKLHVKFNRDMDKNIQPMVTYGQAEPYTDYTIYGDWETAREWVGTAKIDPFIDQGNQFIRVKDAAAEDDTWLKTGTDEGRFKFNISKVDAAAMTLQGRAEEDGVHLSWKQDDYDTLAGYNVYRSISYNKDIAASEQGFEKINNVIVPASTGEDGDIATYGAYEDSAVDPVTSYYYYFTVVDTQFNESEPSNVVQATTSAIDLSQAVISVSDQTYTGENICPEPTVMLNGGYLRKGTDYTVVYADNTLPGKATIVIKGKGDYSGEASATFGIAKAMPTFEKPSKYAAVYGQSLGEIELPDGFSWEDDLETPVGDAGARIFYATYTPADTGIYDVVNDVPVLVRVTRDVDSSMFSIAHARYVYDGSAYEPILGSSIVPADAYSVAYRDNVNAGIATAVVSGNGYYTGSCEVEFAIDKADPSFEVPGRLSATYGQMLGDIALPDGFAWQDDITTPVGGVGTNEFLVSFTPADVDNFNVVDCIPVYIEVAACPIDDSMFELNLENEAYTGSSITKDIATELVENEDYAITYANNINVGKAIVTIEGRGSYSGKLEYTFEIIKTEADIIRVAGNGRYDTMADIVSAGFDSADMVILASGSNFPDALSASALAGAYDAPVLLTDPKELSSQASSVIEELGAKRVTIMGGPGAVSPEVESDLASMGLSLKRVAGSSRQATSLDALTLVAKTTGCVDTVIIANCSGFADSLSVSPYSYSKKAPVVLTESDGTVSADALFAIRDSGASRAIIVGGTAVVSEQAVSALQTAGLSVERWGGNSRYETSAEIAKHEIAEGMSITNCAVATGSNFPDALAGGALLGSKEGVLLLAADSQTSAIDLLLAPNKAVVDTCYLLGGQGAVSSSLESYVRLTLE